MKNLKTAAHGTPSLTIVTPESHSQNGCVRASTALAAKNRGIGKHFLNMIKGTAMLALEEFRPGDIVDSKRLCAEIRYGRTKDEPVDADDVPGLDKGERLRAGSAIKLLVDEGELPMEYLGRDSANLRIYRVI